MSLRVILPGEGAARAEPDAGVPVDNFEIQSSRYSKLMAPSVAELMELCYCGLPQS